jgi:ferric-dicitrate binding protein FerR (iron transport regulator)
MPTEVRIVPLELAFKRTEDYLSIMEPPFDAHIAGLAHKWLTGEIGPEEELEFAAWYNQFNDEADLFLDRHFAEDAEMLRRRIYNKLSQKLNDDETRPRASVVVLEGRWKWIAAACILGLVAGTWYYAARRGSTTPTAHTIVANDLPPGGDKAVLTLSSGKRVVLDKTSDGMIAQEGGSKVVKPDSGKLVYDASVASSDRGGAVQYNTLETPRGGQFQLTLPDGTRVWLNAASSIRYPTAFTGKERRVTVTGEVFMEVARKDDQPFFVTVTHAMGKPGDEQTVEVLGTAFNVNAYDDEPATGTTLLEGAVRVRAGAHSVLLRPGERVVSASGEDRMRVAMVDVDAIIAWKNGLFEFDNADLPFVMRQLARWYDVEVRFQGPVPARRFNGEIQRSLSLKDVLEALGRDRIHCRIEGRSILVSP